MDGEHEDGGEGIVVEGLLLLLLLIVVPPLAADLEELSQHRSDELAPLGLVRPPPLPLRPSGDASNECQSRLSQ